MFEFLNKMKNQLENNKFIIFGFLFVSLAVAISYFIYNYYLKNRINHNYVSNSEFNIENAENAPPTEKVADFYYFYTKWCPHCKIATPIINTLKKQIQDSNNRSHDVYINFIDVDCDKDKNLADKFNVVGYPTIKLVYNSNTIEYDAKPDIDTLNEFLKTSLANKKKKGASTTYFHIK
jgi:thiol-disulfide isomerase/thioredoxin